MKKIFPYLLGFIFFVCILGFVFMVRFPISCEPSDLRWIADYFGKC